MRNADAARIRSQNVAIIHGLRQLSAATKVVLFALSCLLVAGIPNAARAETAALELILAIDCPSSVQPSEFALQMRGIADASRAPGIVQALSSATLNSVAVTLVQWSGDSMQTQALP